MGLDTVELILRCEEVFAVELEDWRLEQVRTVGDMYRVLCQQLCVKPLPYHPPTQGGMLRLNRADLTARPPAWTPENVWETLVEIIIDQLQVRPDEVRYDATFVEDLGCA